MPREVVEIDPSSLEDRRKLIAWCLHPNDAKKRAAFIAAQHYQDLRTAKAEGNSAENPSRDDFIALAEQRRTADEILADDETLMNKVVAAAHMLESLLEGREINVKDGAAATVASEMRTYYDQKRQRGNYTNPAYVLSDMWTPYKPVAHLVLAMWQIEREALPEDLKSLSEEQEAELLWKAEAGDQEANALKRDLMTEDWRLVLERAETIRQAAIDHPKLRIKDADTVQFVCARGVS